MNIPEWKYEGTTFQRQRKDLVILTEELKITEAKKYYRQIKQPVLSEVFNKIKN